MKGFKFVHRWRRPAEELDFERMTGAMAGFVAELMQNASLKQIRKQIGLNDESGILCISTEGDTDRNNYRRIVWDGLHPSFYV